MTALAERGQSGTGFPIKIFTDHAALVLLLWAGFLPAVLLFTLGVSIWREIEISGWDRFVQLVRWYALFIGGHMTYVMLPLTIAHGGTRRQFLRSMLLFIPAFAAVVAALATLGYPIEGLLYNVMDWPQGLDDGQIFGGATALPMILQHNFMVAMLWSAGGLFIGAAFYRDPLLGLVSIPAGLLVAALSSVGWLQRAVMQPDQQLPVLLVVGSNLSCTILVLVLAWLIARDMPLRNKSE